MRKRNKILMATVSVLLCLVLVTTCGLSGIYAKYTTKDSASLTVGFKKLGVTVEAIPNATYQEQWGYKTSTTGNSVSVELDNLRMGPGDEFKNAIMFKITGTAQVNLRVKLYVDITYNSGENETNSFYVPTNISGDTTGGPYMPIGFKFGVPKSANSITQLPVCDYWQKNTAEQTENKIIENIDSKVDLSKDASGYLYKRFDAGDTIAFHREPGENINSSYNIDKFYIGFEWLYEGSTNANTLEKYDKIEKYFNDKGTDAPTMKVKYTVVVEQVL